MIILKAFFVKGGFAVPNGRDMKWGFWNVIYSVGGR
jgi:hypothetical protein